ncbi:MAG: hypothetical protein ACRDB9_07640 [Cetobacterium sp.]
MREDENYILNYAALLACIIGEVPTEKAIKYIAQQELVVPKHMKRVENARNMGKNRRVKTRVINIQTGEEKIFKSTMEACRHLGVFRTVVSNYMKENKVYKNEFRFERVDQ